MLYERILFKSLMLNIYDENMCIWSKWKSALYNLEFTFYILNISMLKIEFRNCKWFSQVWCFFFSSNVSEKHNSQHAKSMSILVL